LACALLATVPTCRAALLYEFVLDQMIERITLDDINVAFDRIRSTEAVRQVVIF